MSKHPTSSLGDLLYPRSIAIVGASGDPARIGGRPIAYTQRGEFEGHIYPVNIRSDEIQGLPAYKSIADIDGPVDFALIALPARAVSDAVRDAAAGGVKTCLIFSSGFAETGDAGKAHQDELVCIARESGMRIIGPNCLGVFNAHTGFYPCFSTSLDRNLGTPGPFAVASQSGAYGSHIFYAARERGIDIGHWITTGNEADVDVSEVIGLYADHADCDVIMAYAEGFASGERLVTALEAARQVRKPVVFMKVGRSDVGAQAVASHTAALAGEDRVFDAICRQYGVHRARTTEELLDVAYACRRKIFPAGKRLGLVSISGGAGVLMADAAHDYDLDVPAMPEHAQQELLEALPFASPRNPVDITAQAFNKIDLIATNLKIMLQHGRFDAIVAFFTMVAGSSYIADDVRAALLDGVSEHKDKLVVLSILADREIVAGYEDDGFLVFEDPSRAIAAIAALIGFAEAFNREAPAVQATGNSLSVGQLAEAADEEGAKTLIANQGIPSATGVLATTALQASEAVDQAGRPCAMKVVSQDIAHKTDVGGVALNVGTGAQASTQFDAMMKTVSAAVPDGRIAGISVVPMAGDGTDCIIGIKNDPTFGPMVLCGLGGVLTEILDDISMRRAPISRTDALQMIAELRGAKLFEGVRGAPAADVDALVDALVSLSGFAVANASTIQSIDINPLRVFERGQGVLALDALIEVKS